MDIIYFNDDIKRFIEELTPTARKRYASTLILLKQRGYRLRMPFSRPILSGLFELRIHGDHEVRLLYTFRDGAAILLLGFIKKTETTPYQHIDLALQRLASLDE